MSRGEAGQMSRGEAGQMNRGEAGQMNRPGMGATGASESAPVCVQCTELKAS